MIPIQTLKIGLRMETGRSAGGLQRVCWRCQTPDIAASIDRCDRDCADHVRVKIINRHARVDNEGLGSDTARSM